MFSADRLDHDKTVSSPGFSRGEFAFELDGPELQRDLHGVGVGESAQDEEESQADELHIEHDMFDESSGELLSLDPVYICWLRIVCLRVLVLTPALGQLNGRFGYELISLSKFTGLTNLEDFCRNRPLGQVHRALE